MKLILDRLYQGAVDEVPFLPNDITRIVAVGYKRYPSEIKSYHLPLIEYSGREDSSKEHWRNSSDAEIIAAIELVFRLMHEGETLFVHCDGGICRSVGISVAYAVRAGHHETFKAAYDALSGFAHEWRSDWAHHNPFDESIERITDSHYWKDGRPYRDWITDYSWNWDLKESKVAQ